MKKSSKKRLIGLLIIALIVVAAVVFWRHSDNGRSNRRQPIITKDGTKNKTSGPAKSTSQGEGGAIDNEGASTITQSSSAKSVTSSSGIITLQHPTASEKIASGDTLSGTAKVDSVYFRLIDSSVGVVAQDSLKVVDGKFSGSLHFQARAASGRLDVFSLDPTTGSEINEVQIAVKF